MLVSLRSGDVGGSARQQGPVRHRPRQISAPDLHNAGLSGLREECWSERLDRIGRDLFEDLPKTRKLGTAERIPSVSTFIRPGDLDPIPNQAKIQRRVNIPTKP